MAGRVLGVVMGLGAGMATVVAFDNPLGNWIQDRTRSSRIDPSGDFPHSRTMPGILDYYYSQSLQEPLPPVRPSAQGKIEADVCVVGGGLAGLNTALGLAERGKSVVLVEEHRIGFGASARNAGMAIAGFQLEGSELTDAVGLEKAQVLYQLSVDAQKLLRKRIREHNIKCDAQDSGLLNVSMFESKEDEVKEEVDELNHDFHADLEYWPPERVKQYYSSDLYYHGIFDPHTFTVNPLGLVLGLARVAESKGVKIYENTPALSLQKRSPMTPDEPLWEVITGSKERAGEQARIVAKDVVLAGAATMKSEVHSKLARGVVPVFTYIVVTKPLGDKLQEAIRAPFAVCDDRFALNYYRPLPGGRILWGGLAQTFPCSDPRKLEKHMIEDLLKVFPQLKGQVEAESVWGGTMAFGMDLMPLLGKQEEGLWYCTGFGGHGLIPTTLAGELLASAIAEKDQRWKMFSQLFPLRFVAGPLGRVWAQLTYWAYIYYDESRLWWQSFKKGRSGPKPPSSPTPIK